jgi:hypothetical protein
VQRKIEPGHNLRLLFAIVLILRAAAIIPSCDFAFPRQIGADRKQFEVRIDHVKKFKESRMGKQKPQ